MSLSAAQRAMRPTVIGASEASAIVTYPDGTPLNPWKEGLDVFGGKTLEKWGDDGPLEVEDEDEHVDEEEQDENPFSRVHLDVGNAVEPVIIDLWEAKFGREVIRQDDERHPGTVRHPKYPMIAATPDGLLDDTGLECKWCGSRRRRDWGRSGTEIPDYYLPQVQISMEVFDRPTWHVAALVDGSPRFYLVERDQALIDGWMHTLVTWWERHVVAGVPPEARSQATAKRYLADRYPTSKGALLPATARDLELGLGLLRARARAKDAAEEAEAYANAIKARIGAAEGIAGVATWKLDAQGTVSWKGVAEAMGAPLATIERFRGAPGRRFLLKTKGA